MFARNLNHFKSVSAHHFFVNPADQNYALASVCYRMGLQEFFWQAAQAIEKYLKAGLVLNDVCAPRGHELKKLWDEYSKAFQRLPIEALARPKQIPERIWGDADPVAFLQRLDEMGSAESRYGLVSWWFDGDELAKLDALVFELRRRTIGLDWIVGADFTPSEAESAYVGRSYEDVLSTEPRFQPRPFFADFKNEFSPIGPSIEHVIRDGNATFSEDATIEKILARYRIGVTHGGINSLRFHYLECLELERAVWSPELSEQFTWLLENISIGREVDDYIRGRLEYLRTRSSRGPETSL